MKEDVKALFNDLIMVSHVAAVLSVAGKMALSDQQALDNAVHVWAAYIRNKKNVTHTAMAIGRSRRAIRRVLRQVESDEGLLPETVRRVLLRDRVRPSFAEIVADLSRGMCDLEPFEPEEQGT